jgi:signal transduction histidine kinase
MQDPATQDYRRLLDALPCYVMVQGPSCRVLWTNSLTRRDFGPYEEKKCYELYRIPGGKCSDCPVDQTFADGDVHSKEMTLTRGDGSRINVIVYAAPVRNDEGTIVSVIETAVNITSVKDIQKQLILVGQTVAGMAHSIKNIMMGLEGGIYDVNKGLEDKNQNEVKDGWEMVLLNFEKISHIVKDIVYCSKEREPDFQKIAPNNIVRQIYDLFQGTAARYGISIQLELDEHLTSAVIDPVGFHTVLANLVTNAMDACKLDLWKDTHVIELRTHRGRDGSTRVEVADNGMGIGKALKTHVFEEFFTSKGDKGTGLGLMVTQKIMREHGGHITFRSRPKHGTTFVVTFPPRELPETGEAPT